MLKGKRQVPYLEGQGDLLVIMEKNVETTIYHLGSRVSGQGI